MANGGEHQIYVTAHFDMLTPWVGEMAQIGWRLGVVPTDTIPDKGLEFTPLPASASQLDPQSGSNATWRWQSVWSADWTNDTWDHLSNLARAEAIKTYWTGIATYFAQIVRLTSVKFALIKPDGKYAYPSSVYELLNPVPGYASSGVPAPPEVAIATTLKANVIGRRGRGRWYLPVPQLFAGYTDNGTVAETVRTNLADKGKTLVGALDTNAGTFQDHSAIVAIASANSATMVRPSQVRVGNHYDAQRRRQQQVTETYTSLAL